MSRPKILQLLSLLVHSLFLGSTSVAHERGHEYRNDRYRHGHDHHHHSRTHSRPRVIIFDSYPYIDKYALCDYELVNTQTEEILETFYRKTCNISYQNCISRRNLFNRANRQEPYRCQQDSGFPLAYEEDE